MNLQFRRYNLQLTYPFRIARGTERVSTVIIVGIRKGDLIGWGEACPGEYYGDSLEKVEACLRAEGTNPLPDSESLYVYFQDLRKKYPKSPAGRAALETALLDLCAQSERKPLYQYLDIPSKTTVTSSFTIGIDQPDTIAQKIGEAADYPLLKVKLGGGNDEMIMYTIRKLTGKPLRIDANGGWTREEAAKKSEWLAKQNVEFIEQPLPKDDVEGGIWLKPRSALPVILDESIQHSNDLKKFAEAAHGVNCKIMKMGGLLEVLQTIKKAKKMGWKTMIGCLIESGIGITAASHLAPLVDYLDLDGNILIDNDPCEGVHAHKGIITLPEAPGLGAHPKDLTEWL